jgi:hypothetical protein
MPSKRDMMKKGLKKRQTESGSRRTGGFVSIFKENLEGSPDFWKVDEGDHTIDIIPYITGENDPYVEEGEPQHVLMLKVHQHVGVGEGSYVCPTIYKKPCPICEHIKQLRSEGADDDEIKALKPKNRCVYNIICYDSDKEEEKGVQLWEVAHWNSERYFTKLASPKRRASGEVVFAHPDEGKSIEFTREGTGATNTNFYGFAFQNRDYIIEDETLDEAHCLDDLIQMTSYDDLYKEYWGEDAPEKESMGRVKKRKKSAEKKEEPEEKQSGDDSGCPGGGEFGTSIDKLDHCEDCDLWKDCARENAKDKKPKEEKAEETGKTIRRKRK